MHQLMLAALTWDPQIRGALITITAVAILCGSVYLLLATNTGARLGFLLAFAGLTGWMFAMAIVWMVFGIGLKGRPAEWVVQEVVTGQLADASTVEATADFPEGAWKKLKPGDAVLGEAQASADKVLLPPDPLAHDEEEGAAPEPPTTFDPPFKEIEDYVQVAGFAKIPDEALFSIATHEFIFLRKPQYAVIQVAPVLEQPPIGGAPPRAVPDPAKPLTNIVMIRDLGNVRFPPFVLALCSFVLFAVSCNVLHRRDKEIMAAREMAK